MLCAYLLRKVAGFTVSRSSDTMDQASRRELIEAVLYAGATTWY